MIVITFKKSKRYFYSLLFVFFFTLLVFITSNSRGAMFASTVIGLSFFLIFYLHRKFSFNTKNLILFMFMIPVALFGVLIFSWGQYISTSIDINSNNLNKFSSNRYELWTIASDAFSDLPVIYKLFGTGAFNKDILPLYINFSLSDILANIVQSSFGQYVHSHNLSIEILISFGVVGIFLFLLISIFIPAYNFYKSKKFILSIIRLWQRF
ncbi:MAG: O-antigen ligase family protein [Leptospiraceae bacterium]|nr:O-antigen ligase family protein [Leptospiraceae bacterium]